MEKPEQQQDFWVADWRVRPNLSELEKDDTVIQLEPKVMAVLEYLASKPGEVFSRQELEAHIWQGTVIGYDALAKAINKLRDAFGDDRKHPQFIQTISKKGYRLIAPVQTEQPAQPFPDAPPANPTTAPKPGLSAASPWAAITGISTLIIIAIAITFWPEAIKNENQPLELQPVLKSKPTIVVLPFRNISPNKDDDYLADGLTSDLTTNLSNLSGLWVTASNASLVYKNSSISAEKARQEFNARYALSGDVNKINQNIRINVHLTDLQKGNILWASRYDRQFTDLFAILDEVTQKILTNLSLKLTHAEKQRLAHRFTKNLEAYDYFLRGQSLINIRTPEDNITAREMYRKAIEIDPHFGRAYAAVAMTYAIGFNRQWPADVDNPLQKALDLSNHAIELDKDLPESYWVAGFVNGNQQRTDDAIRLLNHALSLNPNYADAFAMLAWTYISIGKPQLALNHMARAKHLNPTGGFLYEIQYGKANYFLGNHELALSYLKKAHQGNPRFIDTLYYLAAVYSSLEQYDDASWMLIEAKFTNPNLDAQTWLDYLAIRDQDFNAKLRNDLLKAEAYAEKNN